MNILSYIYTLRVLWRVMLLLWTLVILFLSFYSFPELNDEPLFPQMDKLVHFMMYFVLTILWLFSGFVSGKWIGLFVLLVMVFIFGGSIELLQGLLTEERTASIFDLLFNLIGAVSAIGIYRTFLLGRK